MKFELRHPMPAPAERTWQILFGPEYELASCEASAIDREILEDRTDTSGKRHRRVRITSRKDLPKAMSAAIGADRLSYELYQDFDDDNQRMSWRVVPDRFADKVKAEGTYAVLPAADGSLRIVAGEVSVKIALIGGKIEQAIGSELQRSYEDGADFARDWLRKRA